MYEIYRNLLMEEGRWKLMPVKCQMVKTNRPS